MTIGPSTSADKRVAVASILPKNTIDNFEIGTITSKPCSAAEETSPIVLENHIPNGWGRIITIYSRASRIIVAVRYGDSFQNRIMALTRLKIESPV